MNDQNQTTSTPTEPKLCRMGCGFFVSFIIFQLWWHYLFFSDVVVVGLF